MIRAAGVRVTLVRRDLAPNGGWLSERDPSGYSRVGDLVEVSH